jgi:hypothetical protein
MARRSRGNRRDGVIRGVPGQPYEVRRQQAPRPRQPFPNAKDITVRRSTALLTALPLARLTMMEADLRQRRGSCRRPRMPDGFIPKC